MPTEQQQFDNWNTDFSPVTAINNVISAIEDAAAFGLGSLVGGTLGGLAGGVIAGPPGATYGSYLGAATGGAIGKEGMDIYQGFRDGTYSAVYQSDRNMPSFKFLGVSDTGENKWQVGTVTLSYNKTDAQEFASLSFTGSSVNEAMTGSGAKDTMRGGAGGDWLKGQGGRDYLYGDAGWDRLAGGDGIDRLEDGSGDDYMHGGSGADTFVFTADTTHDVIDDFGINYDHVSGFGTVASYKTESEYFRTTGTQYWVETVTDKDGDVIRFENATHFSSMGKMDTLAEVQALVTDWLN